MKANHNWMLLEVAMFTFFLACTQLTMANFDHSHSQFTRVLTEFVKDGTVNYRNLQQKPDSFNEYIKQLESIKESEFDQWNQEEKLTYWVNAYNAFTINIILENYPIKKGKGLKAKMYPENSIRQISGVWDKINVKSGGKSFTLNDMEHEVLRKKFEEPRIHFAIVCASIGCPELWNHAYEAKHIDDQLEQATKRFVKNREKVRVDLTNGTLYLSKILDWFKEDFSEFKGETKYGKYNGVVSFCYGYFPKAVQNQLKSNRLRIKWLEYDWSLNE